MKELFTVQYGSKLYGTNTAASDTDLKTVYLPELGDLLMAKPPKIFKKRFDAQGQPLGDGTSMPPDGVETEYIPFQTFVRDFINGQTYALEIGHAMYSKHLGLPKNKQNTVREVSWVVELVENFSNSEVQSMTGFAAKQVWDYIKRGERLNEATNVLDVLKRHESLLRTGGHVVRLDTQLAYSDVELGGDVVYTSTVLDEVSRECSLPIGQSVNNNRTMRTLELNGRSYLETTEVEHLCAQVQKLISKYGDRSTAAAETDVDWKSISHAVRVYEQSIELLETGRITFPRKNAAHLLEIKSGRVSLDEVKSELSRLDEEVLQKIQASSVRKKTPELVTAAEQWLLLALRGLYGLR
jgi:hypothetical protein